VMSEHRTWLFGPPSPEQALPVRPQFWRLTSFTGSGEAIVNPWQIVELISNTPCKARPSRTRD
jgi:hypothetical protein